MPRKYTLKRAVSIESLIFLIVFLGFFLYIGSVMGATNMLNTMMNTAYELLISTVFYIMAIAVLAGAVSDLLSEFGIISIANKLISPFVKPIYGLPGASIVGIFSTYLSDNPAILVLGNETSFKRYFKKYQLPALTNVGTAFGMGLIVTTFMIGITPPGGGNLIAAAIIGNVGAIIGSIVSTRLMLRFTAKIFGKEQEAVEEDDDSDIDIMKFRTVREGGFGNRFLESMLDGGKAGVKMGMEIIPGVLIICTLVLMLTNGASASGLYTGAAFEGVGLLPDLAQKLDFILKPLFNLSNPEAISVPVTALGAAGAAISLVPGLVAEGKAFGNDVAVFTAMCMCWSGFLSTHVAMMESLRFNYLTGKAIFCHTIGGLMAGISANLIYQLYSMLAH